MKTDTLEVFRNQLQRVANHHEREVLVTRGQGGWVNVAFVKPNGRVLASWGFDTRAQRWSYNQAPSTDPQIVSEIMALVNAL